MSKYRIALLPGNTVGVELLEKAVEILFSLGLNAEYLWIDKDIKDIKDFRKNLERMKSTSCALATPLCFFENLSSFHPVSKMKEIFHLFSHFYFFRSFLSSPLSFTGIVYPNLPGIIPLYPMPESLRNSLECLYPQMAFFANQKSEELFANLTIHTKKDYSSILENAFQIALQYGFRKLLLLKEEESFFGKDILEIVKKYPTVEMETISIKKACQRAVHVSESPEMLVAPMPFAQTMSYFYDSLQMGFSASIEIGKSYALFLPTEGRATILCILLAIQMLLKHLGESQKETKLYASLEKLIQEDSAHLSFLDSLSAEKEFLSALISLLH